MKLSIRAATVADLAAMMSLEKRAATAAHWSPGQYEALFGGSGPDRVALTMLEESRVQGFVIARVLGDEWEIENIAIAGTARRRGLGTRLLGELLDMARARGAAAIFLEVRESNQAARALYEKWAFLESGRRPIYYKNPPEDAILYRLDFV
ncbi:MAG TPA: ribosomal protein S18-alanine N-acetyltransferase [Terriglobales bacterium]|nr:ribosomal protein S18-alanine N-acetyltransferase [Terriglobales bacterium]